MNYKNIYKTGILLALLFLISFSKDAYADIQEQLIQKWRWANYTTEHGLPSNNVFNIIKTPSGVVWAATYKGPAWFDGFVWHSVLDSGIHLTKNYNIYPGFSDDIFLTFNGKVYKINKIGYRKLGLIFENQELSINTLTVYKNGGIILQHIDSLNRYTRLFLYSDAKLKPFPMPDKIKNDKRNVMLYYTKGTDILWMTTFQGLFRYKNEKWEEYISDMGTRSFNSNRPITNKYGFGIINVWSKSDNSGIWIISDTSNPVKILDQNTTWQTDVKYNRDGNSIIISNKGEISLFKDKSIVKVPYYIHELQDISSYAFDNEGTLFIASMNGISICRLESDQMTYIKPVQNEYYPKPLESQYVINDILKRKDGSLWFATGAGIIVKDSVVRNDNMSNIADPKNMILTGINEDVDGNVWVCSGASFTGAYRWDGKKWKHYSICRETNDCYVHRIIKDKQGRLWFLTISGKKYAKGYGVFLLDNGIISKFSAIPDLDDSRVYTFLEDKQGRYWFGTFDGIYVYDGTNTKFFNPSNGLINGEVFQLIEASDNNIMYCTKFRGIGLIDNFRHKTISKLNSSNLYNIWDLTYDNNGILWMSTSYGFYSYYDNTLTYHGKSSGLNNHKIWPLKIDGKNLMIGTSGGGVNILNIDPKDYRMPVIKLNTPISKTESVFINWDVYSYMGEIPQDEIEVRYKVDDTEWSDWTKDREIHLFNLSDGEHVFRIQTKNFLGMPDNDYKEALFDIPLAIHYRPEFIIPIAIIIFGSIVFFVLLFRYKTNKKLNEVLADKNKQIEKFNTELSYQNMLITDQKEELTRLFEEVLKNERQLKEANAAKDKFFSILAHDLKNPLQGLLTTSDLLVHYREKYDETTLRQHHKTVYKTTYNLLNLLESLLQWSRSQIGKIEYKPKNIELDKLLTETIHLIEIYAKKKNISINHNIENNTQAFADMDMIKSVFRNLISNAIKFTHEGGSVTISAMNKDKYIEVSVADTGIGISKDDLQKLFRIEYHHSTYGTNSEKGTGLGLNLCNDFINFHGCDIWAESEPGKGSVFKFTLPKQREK